MKQKMLMCLGISFFIFAFIGCDSSSAGGDHPSSDEEMDRPGADGDGDTAADQVEDDGADEQDREPSDGETPADEDERGGDPDGDGGDGEEELPTDGDDEEDLPGDGDEEFADEMDLADQPDADVMDGDNDGDEHESEDNADEGSDTDISDAIDGDIEMQEDEQGEIEFEEEQAFATPVFVRGGDLYAIPNVSQYVYFEARAEGSDRLEFSAEGDTQKLRFDQTGDTTAQFSVSPSAADIGQVWTLTVTAANGPATASKTIHVYVRDPNGDTNEDCGTAMPVQPMDTVYGYTRNHRADYGGGEIFECLGWELGRADVVFRVPLEANARYFYHDGQNYLDTYITLNCAGLPDSCISGDVQFFTEGWNVQVPFSTDYFFIVTEEREISDPYRFEVRPIADSIGSTCPDAEPLALGSVAHGSTAGYANRVLEPREWPCRTPQPYYPEPETGNFAGPQRYYRLKFEGEWAYRIRIENHTPDFDLAFAIFEDCFDYSGQFSCVQSQDLAGPGYGEGILISSGGPSTRSSNPLESGVNILVIGSRIPGNTGDYTIHMEKLVCGVQHGYFNSSADIPDGTGSDFKVYFISPLSYSEPVETMTWEVELDHPAGEELRIYFRRDPSGQDPPDQLIYNGERSGHVGTFRFELGDLIHGLNLARSHAPRLVIKDVVPGNVGRVISARGGVNISDACIGLPCYDDGFCPLGFLCEPNSKTCQRE
ncbi:MAG: hypothetical protein C4523_12290 [Myxococcales bacterium]|nr:MAG: hypothetical protein C4523_12290 [Myxococcales bacterium]